MGRLAAHDYFGAALAIVGESGSGVLTIDALSRRLGVTKGSFYHHFPSTTAFIELLLPFWADEHGEQWTVVARGEAEPGARLDALFAAAAALPHPMEAALRAWGRGRAEVAEAVARVDRSREKAMTDAIVANGVDRPRARLLARAALHLLIGTQQRESPVDVRRLRAMLAELRLLVADV